MGTLGLMKGWSTWQMVAAILCGLPVTVVYVAFLPLMLMGAFLTVRGPSEDGLWFLVPLVCGGYSLCWYWHLATATAKRKRVRLGSFFWLAVVSAVVAAAVFVLVAANNAVSVLLVSAAAFRAFRLYTLQNQLAGDSV